MEASLYLLVPLSVALVFLIGWVFWRALEGGQFDDLERPAHDILMDDDRPGSAGNPDRPGKPGTPSKPGKPGKPK
jgi:cbb3-type cytochrome oxidase maturation protein